MARSTVDAVVVGAGPAGSTAAFVLARGGARVALVDKATFGRDKVCGDLVGPRALALLASLGLAPPASREVGEMMVVGPPGDGCSSGHEPGEHTPTMVWPSPACASTPGCATPPSPPEPTR